MAIDQSFSGLTVRIKGDAADAWDLHYQATLAKARGEDVIILSVGDPDFATPTGVADAAYAAIQAGDTHYASILGDPEFRSAIAEQHNKRSGQGITAENVIVTSGAQNALFSSSMCLLNPGDEAIVLQPMYVTYEATIQAPGAKLVPVVLDSKNGFRLNRDTLFAAITERTKAIFYASPCNPSGIALSQQELGFIAEAAAQHNLWVVADEVYADFVFDKPFTSSASVAILRERLVTIGSLSKSYAMSGWRVGWAIAPVELIAHMEKLALCMLYGLPGFIQQAGLHALRHCQQDLATMRDQYQLRIESMFSAFSAMPGLRPVMPEGGMFMLVDVRECGLRVSEFVAQLYAKVGVSVLDATAFGASTVGHIRVSATVSDDELAEAISRIGHFIEELQDVE